MDSDRLTSRSFVGFSGRSIDGIETCQNSCRFVASQTYSHTPCALRRNVTRVRIADNWI